MATYYYAVAYDTDTEQYSLDMETTGWQFRDGAVWDDGEWQTETYDDYAQGYNDAAALLEYQLRNVNSEGGN